MASTWKDGKRVCQEWAMRSLKEDPRSKDPNPDHRPFCCGVPPYEMFCKCDGSCKTTRGDHRCGACGWTWRIVGHYTGNFKHKKCEVALNEFAKFDDALPPGWNKTWCKVCSKRSRWVAWIETVGPDLPTLPLSECEACRSNSNDRFAYGCSDPCKNMTYEDRVRLSKRRTGSGQGPCFVAPGSR